MINVIMKIHLSHERSTKQVAWCIRKCALEQAQTPIHHWSFSTHEENILTNQNFPDGTNADASAGKDCYPADDQEFLQNKL